MDKCQSTQLVGRFFSGTGETYDFISNATTLGFDRWWKRKILNKIPKGSLRILDQACGTGILTFKIARRFPLSQVVGVDMTEEYLNIARSKARRLTLRNVTFLSGRAEEVFAGETFDCITSSYLAKYAELGALIENIQKMLRIGGALIMHDFTYPSDRTVARLLECYLALLKKAGTRWYPEWRNIFCGLPELLRETKWVRELIDLLQTTGFSETRVESLTLGTSAIVTALR